MILGGRQAGLAQRRPGGRFRKIRRARKPNRKLDAELAGARTRLAESNEINALCRFYRIEQYQ